MSQANSIYNCQNCGNEYSTENQTNFKSKLFCCKECLEEYNRNNQNKQVPVYVCEYCGAEFTQNTRSSTIRFCCKSCKSKYSNNTPGYKQHISESLKNILKLKEMKN